MLQFISIDGWVQALAVAGSFLNQCGHLKNELGSGYESIVKTPAPQALGPVSAEMLGGHGGRLGIPVSESGSQDRGLLSKLVSRTSYISEFWAQLRAPASVNKEEK